jgi:VWFA-related protein
LAAPEDEAFLLTFAGSGKLAVPTTTDHMRILNALRKSKTEFGTRFHDALIESIDYLASSARERRALIVFSDGADHYSSSTFEQVVSTALFYDLPIFVVRYAGDDPLTWRPESRQKVQHRLERLAGMTGGKAVFPSSEAECQQMLRQIADMIHYQYQIGFYNSEPFGQNTNVEVRLRGLPSAKVIVKGLSVSVPAL